MKVVGISWNDMRMLLANIQELSPEDLPIKDLRWIGTIERNIRKLPEHAVPEFLQAKGSSMVTLRPECSNHFPKDAHVTFVLPDPRNNALYNLGETFRVWHVIYHKPG